MAMIASLMAVPSATRGRLSTPCMTSRTVRRLEPSLPPGWKTRKSAAVKPRPSSSAMASASPSASCIRVEEVGARPCGQASSTFGSSSTMVAARPSVDAAFEVMAISGTA